MVDRCYRECPCVPSAGTGNGGPVLSDRPTVPGDADSASGVRSTRCRPLYLRFRVKLLVTAAPLWIFTVVTVGW